MARGPNRTTREARPGSIFPSEAVARNVRVYRGIHGMKQADLAERMSGLGLDWTAGTVGFVERYERAVTVDEYVALAVCFGIPIGALLDPSGPAVIDGPNLDLCGVGGEGLEETPGTGFIPSALARQWLGAGLATIRYAGPAQFEVRYLTDDEVKGQQ